MWQWLFDRGPDFLAHGLINYAGRCPAIPACPDLACPPCPGLTCGDCVVPACPACPACRPYAGAAAGAQPKAREAEEACDCSGLGAWAYLIFLFGIFVGFALVACGYAILRVLHRVFGRAVRKADGEDELELRPIQRGRPAALAPAEGVRDGGALGW